MHESILQSIKKLIGGIPEDYSNFDEDVTTQINTAFARLHTLGVGPENGFAIEDGDVTWDEFMEEGSTLNMCKTYIQLKVRQYFDPPTISSVLSAMQEQIKEIEWVLGATEDTI